LKRVSKHDVSYIYIMTHRIVAGPPYLEACTLQIQELIKDEAKIKALEANIENIKIDIAVERERMRKRLLFKAFGEDIRKMNKEDNLKKKKLVARRKHKLNLFKSKLM
jgi:hypothetical protein